MFVIVHKIKAKIGSHLRNFKDRPRLALIPFISLMLGVMFTVIAEKLINDGLSYLWPSQFADNTLKILNSQKEEFGELKVLISQVKESSGSEIDNELISMLDSKVDSLLANNSELNSRLEPLVKENLSLKEALLESRGYHTGADIAIGYREGVNIGGNMTFAVNQSYLNGNIVVVASSRDEQVRKSLSPGHSVVIGSSKTNCRITYMGKEEDKKIYKFEKDCYEAT